MENRIFKDNKTDWKKDKEMGLLVRDSYQRLNNYSKTERLTTCGTKLQFKNYSNGDLKLQFANFCQCRLCPMCVKRKSIKVFAQTSKIMNIVKDEYAFLFLTLTVKNCKGEELEETIRHMMKSFDRLFKRRSIQKINKGWFRALEVTYNQDEDTFHPHFHIIIAVNKSYFKSRDYIKQADWTQYWKDSVQVDYIPVVDIRRFKVKNDKEVAKSVSEAAKYTVKTSDYIKPNNLPLQDKLIETLDESLHRKRLIAYGGRFKEVHKELKLDDIENGDLINLDVKDEVRFDDYIVLDVKWNVGLSNYFITDVFE